MKTLHIDLGRQMGGGQWQAIYLLERLAEAKLLARPGSPLLEQARARGIDASAFSIAAMFGAAQRAELIHAHEARAHAMAAAVPGARLVVARRVAFPVGTGLPSRVKYARANLFLAVSRCAAAELERAGVSRDKIRVVHDGVPLREPGRGDAIVALASKREDLVRRAAELAGVEVRFTRDLWDDLTQAKMFLYASDSEGLGSAALAAMCAEDFAAAIARLLREPQLAREMGRRGRERVEAMFTVEEMVRRTVAAYHEVLG